MLTASIFLFLTLLTPLQTGQVTFRIIIVPTEGAATELRTRILAGESFETLARQHSKDPSASAGGLMGPFAPSDLRRELQTALSGLAAGQVSSVLKMGTDYFFLQLVGPSDGDWAAASTAAQDSFQKGRYAEAAQSFSKAVALAEKFGTDDDRLGESLNGLAESYYRQQNFSAGAAVSRRILSIRWSAESNKGDIAVADLVDRFADVLTLAYFKGNQFTDALKKYQDAMNRTPVNEALYLAMSSLLIKAELTAEAEEVMRRAAAAFPSSRRLRYKQAEMYRDSGRMQKALETFQDASQMKAPASMPAELDRQQLSFIYQRMGGINVDLTQFDAAVAAYKKAVEISPENADARIALGDVYLRRGQHTEAIAEYTRVVQTHADKALPHYRLADAKLQMGNFAESALSAEKALTLDGKERKARYVRGMALIRMGRTEEGQKELEGYRQQEAAAQAEINEQRDIIVSNRAASALVLSGQGEAAIASFRKSIETHPTASSLRLNFGMALGILGRHREAAATLQTLLDSGVDDFLVVRALAHEYDFLKDDKNSQKHTALYIRSADAALEEELR